MLTREGLSQTASLTLAAVWPYYVAALQAPEIAQADFAASKNVYNNKILVACLILVKSEL